MDSSGVVPEGPDADVQEQRQPVVPDQDDVDFGRLTEDIEVPEPDALEQAQTVPFPDEDEPESV